MRSSWVFLNRAEELNLLKYANSGQGLARMRAVAERYKPRHSRAIRQLLETHDIEVPGKAPSHWIPANPGDVTGITNKYEHPMLRRPSWKLQPEDFVTTSARSGPEGSSRILPVHDRVGGALLGQVLRDRAAAEMRYLRGRERRAPGQPVKRITPLTADHAKALGYKAIASMNQHLNEIPSRLGVSRGELADHLDAAKSLIAKNGV